MVNREVSDPSEQYVTLQVTASADSPDLALLRKLAATLDLSVTQRLASTAEVEILSPPESWQLGRSHFLDASYRLWNSDVYGLSAFDYLARYRRTISVWQNGDVSGPIPRQLRSVKVAGAPLIPAVDPRPPRCNLPDDALLERGRMLWLHYHLPFRLTASFREAASHQGRELVLASGEMSQEGLADFVVHKGYDRHTLRGTIGKMFDALRIVGGTATDDEIEARAAPTEFIARDELTAMMEYHLSGKARSELSQRIETAIDAQLASGRPYEHGEVIIEGGLKGPEYTRIATCSLAAIALSYTSPDAYPAQFLRQNFGTVT